MEQNNVKKITYIDIQVRARVANPVGNPFIVCGNKDYTVRFDFDEDWAGYKEKTARFVFNGKFIDVPFTGNECPVPMLSKTSLVKVGAYVDGLSTTSPAVVRCVRSVLCGNESEAGTGSVVDLPLTITENGVIETPKNMRYNPITVDVQVDDQPLTLTDNGTTEAPEGVRYTPIHVAVPKPTLNAPTISVNVSNAVLLVYDTGNGLHTTEYILYSNGEQVNTFTAKKIKLTEYMTVNGDETIQVRCTNSEFFNESELSNGLVWQEVCDGTAGLTYGWNYWSGLGSCTATDITVGSKVNNGTITNIEGVVSKSLKNLTIRFPDTIYYIADCMRESVGVTFIFGANTGTIVNNAFYGSSQCIYDFRKAKTIPTIGASSFASNSINSCKIIVPDEMYEEWRKATNWTKIAGIIVRASDYVGASV